MPHFFITSNNIYNNTILINNPENYRHIAKALRAKVGEQILLIDENKIQYEGIIKNITVKEILVNITKSYKSLRELGFNLYLAQAPLRSDSQNLIMEKATELGVSGVYPIYTNNCALNKSVIEKKIPKWQRIMYEASKQCERAAIPECFDVTDLPSLCKSGDFDYIIAFCERLSQETFRTFYSNHKDMFKKESRVLVIIGPEGGFSQEEFTFFKDNSIPMLTLGNLILKAETATIIAIGSIINEYNYSK